LFYNHLATRTFLISTAVMPDALRNSLEVSINNNPGELVTHGKINPIYHLHWPQIPHKHCQPALSFYL